MDGLTQAVVYDTASSPNIYSATVMYMVDGSEKILMISSKKEIITLESKIENDEVNTYVVELKFPNIPSNAEIFSIHCINNSYKGFDDFVIGITYESAVDEQLSESYLSIYFGSPGSSLEAVMKNCETLMLDFFPYKLTHVIYVCDTDMKGLWLLSGNDRKIHSYKIDEEELKEQAIEKYFVEYEDTKDSIILCFGSKLLSRLKKRISFYGCETGYSMLAIVDPEINEVLHYFDEYFQSPITVMELFNIYNKTAETENILSVKDNFVPDFHIINEEEEICLLVGSAVESAVVYMDVLKNNLGSAITLTNSNKHQATVCALITDVNFDSKNEILLGTYGKYILNYVYENNTWVEQQQYDIRHSVYTICYLDTTDQGVKDVVVMSERGIHILKHEPQDIVELLRSRLSILEVKEN